jgi:hypothetical protein
MRRAEKPQTLKCEERLSGLIFKSFKRGLTHRPLRCKTGGCEGFVPHIQKEFYGGNFNTSAIHRGNSLSSVYMF